MSRRTGPARRPWVRPRVESLETRCLLSGAWGGFGGGPQHAGAAPAAAQPLDAVRWQAPVDLAPQFSGNDLLIHYGSPVITPGNTVIVPVKTGATNGFRLDAFDGKTGASKWSVATDYLLPQSYDWTPEYDPVLTAGGRVYFPGAGGTLWYVGGLDDTGPHAATRVAFYGLGNYSANASAYNGSVYIDTPLTADANGDVFFGFRTYGSNPLGLTSGVARVDASGVGTYVTARAASGGDTGIGQVPHNSAPGLSNDGSTLYVAVVSASTQYYGYLVALDSTTLQLKKDASANPERVLLHDPRNGGANLAGLLDDSTASPTVGPDGDVYFGVMGNPYNGSRGWLLHFSGDLRQQKTPGAFGWDDTVSVVPTSLVPSYHGSSPYLLFSKYNNYAGVSDGGDGVNRIAVLDPGATMVEPHASSNGLLVMNVVESVAGPTPDPQFDATYPNAVREWCINSAAVDAATGSVLANSEDGKLYRWDLASGVLSQVVTLTPGIGEAYTPTAVGPDGTVYAINDATLFAVGQHASALRVVAAASPVTAGVADAVTVTAVDRFGNTVTDYAGTVTFTSSDPRAVFAQPGGATLTGGAYTFTAADAGSHTFAVTLFKAGGQSVTAADSPDQLTQTIPVQVTPAAAVSVLAQAGSPQSAAINTAFATPLQAAVTDAYGNPVPGAAVTFAAPASGAGGTFAGGGATVQVSTDAAGVATAPAFTANGTSGSYVVTASVGSGVPSAQFNLTNTSGSASFVKADVTTQGAWKGAYGADGYNVVGDSASYPAYAAVSPAGQSAWTWAGSSSDARALQKATNPADRVAATWYAGSSFTVDVNVTDGKTHQLALYLLDWDSQGRSERVDVLDAASGAVLATQTATSFSGGEYLVFNVSGHVTLKFTDLAGPNAVLSGLFFG